MNCGENTIKYLLFVFNLVFSLCGLALLICGVLVKLHLNDLTSNIAGDSSTAAIGVIVIGCIIFIIAFFGCCGAIREHQCMVITYAVLLLTILIIQIALAIYFFVVLNGIDETVVKKEYENIFNEYWTKGGTKQKALVDAVQAGFHCCGAVGPDDYMKMPHSEHKYPGTCCLREESETCQADEVFHEGCENTLIYVLRSGGKLLGGIVLGIAGVELIGIIFALCLANSIRNADRRAFRV